MIQPLFEQDGLLQNQIWHMARCAPGGADPVTLDNLDWLPAIVPGTVAAALTDSDQWSLLHGESLDRDEYWYRCAFSAQPGPAVLEFDGLATLAEVWLNGDHLLASTNMYIEHTVKVDLASENSLFICFRSLQLWLEERRPRAKWRTQLAAHRNLRYLRTSLLGRMPGVCPVVPPIGPWRSVGIFSLSSPCVTSREVSARIDSKGKGEVELRLALNGVQGESVIGELVVGSEHAPLSCQVDDAGIHLRASLTIDDPDLWWPHTQGNPYRYLARVQLTLGEHPEFMLPLPAIGFRTITRTGGLDDFELAINNQPIHCRGANWMPLSLETLRSAPDDLRAILTRCRDAGMNMLRVSGTTAYVEEDFYELCDELGILIWQDFMFARMDYPTDDPDFLRSIHTEVTQVLERTSAHACLAVLCGGTEIRQQAAMLGLTEATADNAWFDEVLPAICRAARPDALYCAHSPMGGALPFHTDRGISHAFGVGAYLQPLSTADLETPRFASECLAFSIPPTANRLESDFGNGSDFDWEAYDASVPKDNGADWSFADVTDHYIGEVFHVDVQTLKTIDTLRYLTASGIAVGETMKHTVEAWRRNDFTTGALVWTLNDLSPGGGWGIFDDRGIPKAPYYFLKRAWRPAAMYFDDRLSNGLWCGMHNDGPNALEGELQITLGRLNGQVMEQATVTVSVAPRSRQAWSVEGLLGGFVDANYAYRFGPQAFEIATMCFQNSEHKLIEHHLLIQRKLDVEPTGKTPDLLVSLNRTASDVWLEFSTDHYIDYLILDLPGATLSDNYLSLLPGQVRNIVVQSAREPISGTIRALNSSLVLNFSEAVPVDA